MDLVAVRGSVCGTGAPGVPSDGEHGARPLAEILDGGPGWPLAGAEHRCAIRQRQLTKRSSWLRPVFSFHCYPRPKLERRAIQLGLRGEVLARYAREWIVT